MLFLDDHNLQKDLEYINTFFLLCDYYQLNEVQKITVSLHMPNKWLRF